MRTPGANDERQLDEAMQRNLAVQEPIQEWVEEAISQLETTVPENIAEVYGNLLHAIIGGVHASGWRSNPARMAWWWKDYLRYFVDRFEDAAIEIGQGGEEE